MGAALSEMLMLVLPFIWSTRCWDIMNRQCKTAHCAKYRSLLFFFFFLKTVIHREHEKGRVESVKERENYKWTEESCLIHPHPWHCWNTQTRKLGIADEVNSVWPLDDATGCQVLTTWLVNKHKTYSHPLLLYGTFGHLI